MKDGPNYRINAGWICVGILLKDIDVYMQKIHETFEYYEKQLGTKGD